MASILSLVDKLPLKYRITGPQSIERLSPLLSQVFDDEVSWEVASCPVSSEPLAFVWETACEKAWDSAHKSATVLDRLSNSHIIEDKANLAFLQLLMDVPVLDTYLADNASIVEAWCDMRWGLELNPSSEGEDWWALKAARGNGGKDVWFINSSNYREIISGVPQQEVYVIQRYVQSPLLWNGTKKFHFRCYGTIHADMSAMLYQSCYVLTASQNFDREDHSNLKHITNLSVNKHSPGHPGQIPCHMARDFAEIFHKLCLLWSSVATSATNYMKYQRNRNHFDFFGIDIIADDQGGCWLIEANRLPGLESSSNNKDEEDMFYNTMMLSLLKIVLSPIRRGENAGTLHSIWDSLSSSEPTSDANSLPGRVVEGHWLAIKPPHEAYMETIAPDAQLYKNLFSWRLHTKKNKYLVDLSTMVTREK